MPGDPVCILGDVADADRPLDDVEVANTRLRSALEFAVAVATEADKRQLPVPEGLASFLGQDRLPAVALRRARQAVIGSDEFRTQLGVVAVDDVVDELGRTWLARPDGWADRVRLLDRLADERERREQAESEARRERKRREAAEAKVGRVESASGQHTSETGRLRGAMGEARAAERAATEALGTIQTELAEARTAVRHAADRRQAADRRRAEVEATVASLHERVRHAEAQRDLALAERAGAGLSASGIAELRTAAQRLQRVSDDVAALVDSPRRSRTPLALPGAVIGNHVATAEFLLRSGAAVIVDGYNVAKLGWPALTLEDQRNRLLDMVDNIVRRFACPATVVFDGADVVGAASDRRRLARVTYSPAGVTADDVIIHELEGRPTDRPVVVVTDDQDVRRRARRRGANELSSASLLDVGMG